LTIGSPSGPSAQALPSKELAAEDPRRGSSGGSSADGEIAALQRLVDLRRSEQGQRAEELAIRTGAALGAAMAIRLPDPVQLSRMRERWIEVIRDRVHDRDLKACVMVKVAAAVVGGELKPAHVEEIFAELDKHRRAGTLRGAAGIYFLRAAQALFKRHGLEWTGYASGGRRKPKPR
jgi:hypothetical protein